MKNEGEIMETKKTKIEEIDETEETEDEQEMINDPDICEVCGNEIGATFLLRTIRGKQERYCCTNCAGIFRNAS